MINDHFVLANHLGICVSVSCSASFKATQCSLLQSSKINAPLASADDFKLGHRFIQKVNEYPCFEALQ